MAGYGLNGWTWLELLEMAIYCRNGWNCSMAINVWKKLEG